MTVTLYKFVHPWVGDLVVQLRHLETQTVVDLFRRLGQQQFPSSGYSTKLNGDYSFNDCAKRLGIADRNTGDFEAVANYNAVIPSGNYTPTDSFRTLHGLKAAGTWRLIIKDCFCGDEGSLGSWKLDLR